MLIKIAWRNIWRHKARSSVIVFSVVFGLWTGLFIQAYMNGLVDERIHTAISKEISHIQLHHPDFKKNYEAKYSIPDGNAILDSISRIPTVKAVSGRIVSKGMITTTTGSAGIKISGVDSAPEDSVTHLSNNIISGKYFTPDVRNEILVGEKLLQKLKLKLNSKVVVTLLDNSNNIVSGAYRIKGIYRTQNTPYDETNVFVERSELAQLLGMNQDPHEIAILLTSNELLDSIYNGIAAKHPSLKTESWKEISPEMNLIVSTSGQSMLVYMSIIMLALAFGIVNTMLMAVLERTREIGMLMAVGMNKTRVFTMILLETIFIVFAGTPIGMLLGFFTVTYFGHHGIDMSANKELYASFGFSEVIYPKLSFGNYIAILELVTVTSLISSIFPARKALSLNPSEAIRK